MAEDYRPEDLKLTDIIGVTGLLVSVLGLPCLFGSLRGRSGAEAARRFGSY